MLYEQFLALHQAQLVAIGLPEDKWPALHRKMVGEVFDAGASFAFEPLADDASDDDASGSEAEEAIGGAGPEDAEAEDEQEVVRYRLVVAAEDGIQVEDPEAVWLVDHAWTFTWSTAVGGLEQNEGLRRRMAAILGVKLQEGRGGVEAIMAALWPLAQTYRLNSPTSEHEEHESIWYMADEVGAAIRHCEPTEELGAGPSVGMAPVYYAPLGCTYSIFWPLRTMALGDHVTRDFLPKERDPYCRAARLLALVPPSAMSASIDALPLPPPSPPPSSVSVERGGAGEGQEELRVHKAAKERRQLTIHCDLNAVKQTLSDPRLLLVEDAEAADVQWTTTHPLSRAGGAAGFRRRHPGQCVGSFPNEKYLTCKDLLIETCARKRHDPRLPPRGDGGAHPLADRPIIPLSYNLEDPNDLHAFIQEFRRRQQSCPETNTWIVKPWNKSRSIDVVVSHDNLPHVLRMMDTGPKVCCEYIREPLCMEGHKLDMRFFVLLRRSGPQPLAYLSHAFVVRIANLPYGLNNFHEYQRHCTVMGYRPGMKQERNPTNVEFKADMDREHGQGTFAAVWEGAKELAAEMVRRACLPVDDPRSLPEFKEGRALYGIDVMIPKHQPPAFTSGGARIIRPLLLEVSYMPDCRRAIRERAEFFDDVFRTLLLDDPPDGHVTRIL